MNRHTWTESLIAALMLIAGLLIGVWLAAPPAPVAGDATAAAPPPRGEAATMAEPEPLGSFERVEVALGRTLRGLLALPCPAAGTPEFMHLRMALTALTGGRASALQRRLVEDGRLCQSVSSELTESVARGAASLALEVLPGVGREAVESALLEEFERARRDLGREAVERARRLLLADWLFSHETIEARGATIGAGLALFGADYARRQHEALLAASLEDVQRAARRYLDPQVGGVLGWAGD